MAAAKKDLEAKTAQDTALTLSTMYEDDAGGGFDAADAEAYAIPMLGILQKMSPQVDEADGAYIEGAKAGLIINSVTQEFSKTVQIVPVYFKRSIVEWIPRNAGGGFVAEHTVQEAERLLGKTIAQAWDSSDDGKIHLGEHELVDTRTHYVIHVTDSGFSCVSMPFTSTQMKKSKRLMTQMQTLKFHRQDGSLFTPPMWASVFEFSTVPESNEHGTWHGWAFKRLGDNTRADIAAAAKEFREAIMGGEVKEHRPEPPTSPSNDKVVGDVDPDEDIPF